MRVGVVSELWVYPVKSMRGLRLSTSDVEHLGLTGDRAYAIVDAETNGVASAKLTRVWGRLLECAVTRANGHVEIELGTHVLRSDHPDIDRDLSRIFGRSVRLARTPPADASIERDDPDFTGAGADGEMMVSKIGKGLPTPTFFDFGPLHLLTSASLSELARLHGRDSIELARFRPNFVVDTNGASGFVENDWVGRTMRVGSTLTISITTPTPRCNIPTLAQPGVAKDAMLLRTIAQNNSPPIPYKDGEKWPSIGVYAKIETPGTVTAGDVVWLED